jgi:hypothetical protein
MDNQIESESNRRIPRAAYLSLVVCLGLGAVAIALVWSGRVRPAQAADPCGTDGCPALRSVALFEDAPTGRGGRLAITPEEAIAIATEGELGENDFRISDAGGDTLYDAFNAATAYNSAEDEYLVVWSGDSLTIQGNGLSLLADDEFEIFSQRVDAATGEVLGDVYRVSDMGPDGDPDYDAMSPAVAYNSTGNQYLVVWYGDDNSDSVDNEFEIFGQRVDASNGSELGEDFRISDIGPDGDPSYDATDPAIAYNSADGQYLVIWAGDNDSGGLVEGEFEVFGQRLDAFDGSELGADFRLSDMGPDGNTAYEARFPALSYSSTEGQYLVVWEGDDDSGALIDEEFEIFGQQVDSATGAEIAADVRLSTMGGDTLYDAFNPAVAYNTVENHYLVVWEGEDSSGGLVNGEYEIFGRRVDRASGAVIGGDVRLSDMGPDANPNYEAHDPAVAYDVANNLYLVVWYGDDNTGGLVNGEYEIFGQRVDGTSGVEIGGDFRLSDMGPDGDPSYSAFDPAVAYNSAEDQFLVVWEGDDGSGALANSEYEIFGQQVDAATGAEVGEDLRLSDMGPDGDPLYDASQAAVAYNSTDDQYLVVWEGDDDSDGLLDNEHEIFGQRVDGATGGEIGTDYRLSDMGPDGSPSYGAFTPAVAYNSTEGQYLVVWEGDDGSLGLVDNEYEIFGQRVDGASGAEIGGDVRLSDMGPDGNPDYDAHDPMVAFDSIGNQYLVVWEGDDDSDGLAEEELEIYGQRVDGADGAEIGGDFRLSDMGPDGIPEYGGRDPAVAYDGTGNQYLVVWEGDDDRGELVEGEFEIFGQRYSSAPTLSQTAILADAPDPSLPGRPFTVSFSVTAAVGTPTGVVTVTVSDDSGSCRGLLVGGLGDCALTLSGSGTYTLTAAYGGDSTYAPSSDSEPHTVMPIQTQPTVITILSDAPDPSQPGELFTVTFGVTGTLAFPTDVVTVTVSDDPGSCTDTLSGGVGGCALAFSAPGAYTLTAAYGGDGTLAPSSDTEVHTVVEVNGIRLYLPLVLR